MEKRKEGREGREGKEREGKTMREKRMDCKLHIIINSW